MSTVVCSQCRNQFVVPQNESSGDRTPCPVCGSVGRVITASANIGAVTMTGTVELSVKSGFAIHHLLAAAHFACLSHRAERGDLNSVSEELLTEHRSYVTGTILSVVSAMEATINEVYMEAVDKHLTALAGLEASSIEALAEVWESIEGKPILTKFQVALILARKPKFEKNHIQYQDAENVIRLRNALVHYKAEWDTKLREHGKLEGRLSGKFTLNPFAHTSDVFFPKKCLSHGCAAWSVQSGMAFMEEFFAKMGLRQRFHSYRARLATALAP